jgi:NADH-quinone oxidoreductase subunit K
MTAVGLEHFLVVAASLFSLGFYTVVTRRSAVGILMGVELILNAANLNFVAFWRFGAPSNVLAGQVFPVFVIMVAAAEVAVGLAIVLAMFKNAGSIDTAKTRTLRG